MVANGRSGGRLHGSFRRRERNSHAGRGARSRRVGLACAVVGGGPLEGFIREWSARYGERVRIVTGIPHERVPEYLNAMDLMCAPSETAPNWREVFGRMIVEAFACGVPVIASNSGEIPRVVADAGRIVNEHAPDELADAISEMLKNPALRNDFAARGLERVRTTYTWSIVARRHLDFFEELLQPGAPSQWTD